jgi:hypothetical protein
MMDGRCPELVTGAAKLPQPASKLLGMITNHCCQRCKPHASLQPNLV